MDRCLPWGEEVIDQPLIYIDLAARAISGMALGMGLTQRVLLCRCSPRVS